ncbi:MAG: tetratricopeptide repeat protein [Archangium sp.]
MAVLMLGGLLALSLAAAPSAAQATALAKAKSWEELYLGFAAVSADGVSKGDRPKIADALLKGCLALEGEDPVMAYSLGEKSIELTPTADALMCTAMSAKRTDQRGAAEDALRKGLTAFGKDGRFGLELGRLYIEDGQPGEAAAVLARVPPKSKESTEAKRLLAGVSRESSVPIEGATPRGTPVVEAPPMPGRRQPTELPRSTSNSYESITDESGHRIRQNQYFRFRYFNQARDFGQRADYEGRVQDALEESRVNVKRIFGVQREKPCDVILYSKAEFKLHHGERMAQAVAGFYSMDAIRMNDSAEISPRNRAVLVHEYVHAVMDELFNFNSDAAPVWIHEGTAEFIEWRYLGSDDPPRNELAVLRQMAHNQELPSLRRLDGGPLVGMRNPSVMYALSAMAVKALVARRGMSAYVEFLEDCGRGTPWSQGIENHFGTTVERLDEELADELKTK